MQGRAWDRYLVEEDKSPEKEEESKKIIWGNGSIWKLVLVKTERNGAMAMAMAIKKLL